LTLIFQLGNNFWIEVFTIARATINNTTTETVLTLERAGQFLGMGAVIDTVQGTASGLRNINVVVSNNDFSQLTRGQDLPSFTVQLGNTGNFALGAHICVLMRGSGH